MAALPRAAPAKPKQPRRVLVLGKAAGFVHSSIPLAGRTIEELGKKTGAWSTTITYDPADINEAEPEAVRRDLPGQHHRSVPRRSQRCGGDRGAAQGAARLRPRREGPRQASTRPLIRTIRTLHAGDRRPRPVRAAGRAGGARGGGRGGGQAASLVAQFLAQGDKNSDQRLSRDEFGGLADAWYGKLDTANAGRVSQAEFTQRFAGAVLPAPPPAASAASVAPPRSAAPATRTSSRPRQLGPDNQVGTWPEFNKMIGGFFKFHWNNPQEITYKIDEPKQPAERAVQEAQRAARGQRRDLHHGPRHATRARTCGSSPASTTRRCAPRTRRRSRIPRERSRLRAQLDQARRQGPGLLHGARPRRERLRESRRCSSTCSRACSTRSAICRPTTARA